MQGFKASSEARRAVVDIGTSIRCFIAPTWQLATAALQLLNSDPLFFKVCIPCRVPAIPLPGFSAWSHSFVICLKEL